MRAVRSMPAWESNGNNACRFASSYSSRTSQGRCSEPAGIRSSLIAGSPSSPCLLSRPEHGVGCVGRRRDSVSWDASFFAFEERWKRDSPFGDTHLNGSRFLRFGQYNVAHARCLALPQRSAKSIPREHPSVYRMKKSVFLKIHGCSPKMWRPLDATSVPGGHVTAVGLFSWKVGNG